MKVYLVGIGMGNFSTLTEKAVDVIDKADVVVGAKRMTELVAKNKKIFNSYKPDEIYDYLKNNNFEMVAVLLSGDCGFYSGAKKLIQTLKEFDVHVVCGISSVVYFCSKLKMSWEDIKLLSVHGKNSNVIGYVRTNKKVFLLLNGKEDIKIICEKLCYYGMGQTILYIGQRLSYPDEKIVVSRADDLNDFEFDSPVVMIIENNNFVNNIYTAIDDDEFLRGSVPMTKSEVRTISIAKLCLEHNSVLYDIGAGTGSISVEAGLHIIDGTVFAIEKNTEAVELIEKNKKKFAVDNIAVINGVAPSALEELPPPTHIFIGGSSGNLKEIINCCIEKNSDVKIVINAIAINTVGQVTEFAEKNGFSLDIVCMNVSKNKRVGKYDLMIAQNPVYIFTLTKIK